MSYLSDFDHSFMQRTRLILNDYKGEYDATLLINCLLGLLIVPKEIFLKSIPEDPLSTITSWGIDGSSIRHPGNVTCNNPKPNTIRGFVINLRHSVAHFSLEPISDKGYVHAFGFTNESEFHAVISLAEICNFVWKLAERLENA